MHALTLPLLLLLLILCTTTTTTTITGTYNWEQPPVDSAMLVNLARGCNPGRLVSEWRHWRSFDGQLTLADPSSSDRLFTIVNYSLISKKVSLFCDSTISTKRDSHATWISVTGALPGSSTGDDTVLSVLINSSTARRYSPSRDELLWHHVTSHDVIGIIDRNVIVLNSA